MPAKERIVRRRSNCHRFRAGRCLAIGVVLAALPGIAQERQGPSPSSLGGIRIGAPQRMPSQPTPAIDPRRFRLRLQEPELPPSDDAPAFMTMSPEIPSEPAATLPVPAFMDAQQLPGADPMAMV